MKRRPVIAKEQLCFLNNHVEGEGCQVHVICCMINATTAQTLNYITLRLQIYSTM